HVEWIHDALVIEEQGHKGDQTGVDKFGKHVYANPYEPSQYPILAIGVHLLCCSYALGQVNGPTPVSVYLRMGQSMGKLKDRYIHFGEGADQLCGRMILGLPFNSERLGVLPPHFSTATICEMTSLYWEGLVSGSTIIPVV
ncbi:hypothetical protein L916_19026, partial [Phytophthora nicotianae]